MDSTIISLWRRPLSGLLLCPLLCTVDGAQAQTAPKAASPVEAAASSQVDDWVKRAAARPFFWIKVNAQRGDDKPQPGAAPASNAPARPAVVTLRKAPDVARVPPLPLAPTRPADTSANASANTTADTDRPPAPAGDAPAAPVALVPLVPQEPTPAPPAVEAQEPAVAALPAPPPLQPLPDDNPVQLALLQGEEPHFSGQLMRELRQGRIDLEIQIDADGRVQDTRVLRTSDMRLRRPALAASRDWQFTPPRKAVAAVVSLGFNLDED